VGTASPTQELDVNGNVVATTLTTSGAVTAGSVSTSGAVGAGSVDVSGNVVADEYALDQTGASSSAVAIHAPASNELAIRTNSTERLRIDSSGKVGIGTAVPINLLELKTANDSGDMADIALYSDGLDNNATSSVFLGQSLTRRAEITAIREGSGNQHSLAFSTNSYSAAPVEHVRIDSGGNVGIHTVSPSAPLEVASTTGGVIMPRMTTTQMNAIISPTNGEMIYNTTENKFYGRANGAWTALH
jgi:hypothetical protein